jgi:hypothetical protein
MTEQRYVITVLGRARIELGPGAGGPPQQPGSLLEYAAWMATWSAYTRGDGMTTFELLRNGTNIALDAPGQPARTLEAATLVRDWPEMAAAEAFKRRWLIPLSVF